MKRNPPPDYEELIPPFERAWFPFLRRFVVGLVVAVLILGPVFLAQGHPRAVLTMAIVIIALGSQMGAVFRGGGYFLSIIGALACGVVFLLLVSIALASAPSLYRGLAFGSITGLVGGFIVGLAGSNLLGRWRSSRGIVIRLGMLFFLIVFSCLSSGWRVGFPLAFAEIICIELGLSLGRYTRPVFVGFKEIGLYLHEMGTYLFTFVVGYVTLAVVFAGWFWAAWKLIPNPSFNKLPDSPTFGDFLYFSITTLTTLGYGDITPASGLMKILAGLEALLGIGWVTIVFATLLANLQPRFSKLAERRSQIGQHERNASDKLLEGDINGAMAELKSTIQIDPTNDESRLRLTKLLIDRAHEYAENGDLVAALGDLAEAIKISPKDPGGYFLRGQIRLKMGELHDALDDFDKVLGFRSTDLQAYYFRATAKYQKGDFAGAIEDISRLISKAPRTPNLYLLRAKARVDQGHLDGAVADFDAALKLNPKDESTYLARAAAKAGQGDYDGAIGDCSKAIDLNPNYADAYLARGELYSVQGEDLKSEQDLQQSIRLEPNKNEGNDAKSKA